MSVRRSGLSALRLYAISPNSFGYSKNLRSYLRPSLLLACVVDLKLATVFIPLHLPARTALSRDSSLQLYPLGRVVGSCRNRNATRRATERGQSCRPAQMA